MTMYARVEQGVVRELLETEQQIEELYHPDLLWVDVADMQGVYPGWVVGDAGFAPPEAEVVVSATQVVDVAELARRIGELQEQIRMLVPDGTGQHPGTV